MKHFRSLLSLGAIEDDEAVEPYELQRIRSHQPFAKSTRLSQRKRQNKQRLESNTLRLSFTMIDGKKVPELQHSISTKLSRRQFFYPNRKKNNIAKEKETIQEETEIYLEEEIVDINFDALDSFSLSLPTDFASTTPRYIKPRLNTTLPPPPLNTSPRLLITQSKIQLNMLLPPPIQLNNIQNNNSNNYKKYLPFNPENSITSIRSESIPARTSMNSWPSSQQSDYIANINIHKSTQIRNIHSLSPIYDDEYGHLTQINDTVQELTDNELSDDDDDGVCIVNDYDGLYRPRLATIRSEASTIKNNSNNDVFIDNHIDNTYTYSFPSSQRTSRTITTTNTSVTFNDIEEDDDDDVNEAFEYIPDEEHQLINDDEYKEEEEEEESCINLGEFACFDFKFMSCIGRGAYGVVDKAFHLKSCHIVAIKRSRSLKKRMFDSFCREISILNEFCECEYIINMIESGIDSSKNEICIALEYMNMSSLTCLSGGFTLNEIRKICFSVLSALNELHCKLFVHNDIKPDNILFNDAFDVKLTDFGCCQRMKDINTPLTKPNGSLIFQSFEQKFVSPIKYTTKSDIYSFGITITHILTPSTTQNNNESTPYKIPNHVLNKYLVESPQIIDFLNKCLIKNYHQRWSAKQLLNHEFLNNNNTFLNINNVAFITDKKLDDLEFITDTLINYYLNYNKQKEDELNLFNLTEFPKTPIDNGFTDNQRIENIAKCTGFSADAVQDFIFQCVNDVKNQYLKR